MPVYMALTLGGIMFLTEHTGIRPPRKPQVERRLECDETPIKVKAHIRRM